jgi:hypothetical protein
MTGSRAHCQDATSTITETVFHTTFEMPYIAYFSTCDTCGHISVETVKAAPELRAHLEENE